MNDDTTTRTAGEDDVQRSLRELFAADAATARQPADVAGWAEWTDAAARSARSHRRRSSVVAASAAAVVVVLGVVAVQAWQPASDGLPADDPSGAAIEPIPPLVGDAAGDGSVLMFHGVEVPVPADMLRPDAVRCGTPIADAAFVQDFELPVRACGVEADPERLTTVVMSPWRSVHGDDLETAGYPPLPGERLLPDGRTEINTSFPERDVYLVVTSPDPGRARTLFNGARVVPAPAGCAPRAEDLPNYPAFEPPRTGSGLGLMRVCGYRNDWLVGATIAPLDRELLSKFDRAQGGRTNLGGPELGCLTTVWNAQVAGWWVDDGTKQRWADASSGRCPVAIGQNIITLPITGDLFDEFWSITPGPATW